MTNGGSRHFIYKMYKAFSGFKPATPQKDEASNTTELPSHQKNTDIKIG